MRIRAYQPEDEPALRELHARQAFGYEWPDINDPIFLTKLVLEDDHGRPIMAVLARLTCELYLLADARSRTPRERYAAFLALHAATERELGARGLTDGTCWIPPQIEKPFGRRLARLGWLRDPWPAYSKKIGL